MSDDEGPFYVLPESDDDPKPLTTEEVRARIDVLLAKASRYALVWAMSTLPIVVEAMRPRKEVLAMAEEAKRLSPWLEAVDEAEDDDGDSDAEEQLAAALKEADPRVMRIMRDATVNAHVLLWGKAYDEDEAEADEASKAAGED